MLVSPNLNQSLRIKGVKLSFGITNISNQRIRLTKTSSIQIYAVLTSCFLSTKLAKADNINKEKITAINIGIKEL
jgi:hypothetical protein